MTSNPILEYQELREACIKFNTGTKMGENRKRDVGQSQRIFDEGYFYNFLLNIGEKTKKLISSECR